MDDKLSSKVCIICKNLDVLSNFPKSVKAIDGHTNKCKKCNNKFMKEHRKNNPDKYRDNDYRKNYGITLEDYKNKVKEQNGVCAICGCAEKRKLKYLHIDHNHLTNQVRGLLCGNCNYALGHFRENKQILINAIKYLEKWEGGQIGEYSPK